MNALSYDLLIEVNDAFKKMDDDDSIAAIILTGGNKVFAAGEIVF